MAVGSDLPRLDGYPFEVRYSAGALERARAVAEVGRRAYGYFSDVFGVTPDLAFIVANQADWAGHGPYGLPFFRDDETELRPGIVLMPASASDFWRGMVQDLRDASPTGFRRVLATYPDGEGGVDLQPFFDLITLHELGHAFEVLGDLRLPTFWLGEIFADLVLHAFIATHQRESLPTLEVLAQVGAASRKLASRMRATGFSSLEDLERHYTGGSDSMDPLNYVWYQYRWQRLVATMFEREGEECLLRFWACFHARTRDEHETRTSASLASLLSAEVSPTLGRAVRDWR